MPSNCCLLYTSGTYRSLCFSAEVNVILSTIYFGEAGDDIPTIVGIQDVYKRQKYIKIEHSLYWIIMRDG